MDPLTLEQWERPYNQWQVHYIQAMMELNQLQEMIERSRINYAELLEGWKVQQPELEPKQFVCTLESSLEEIYNDLSSYFLPFLCWIQTILIGFVLLFCLCVGFELLYNYFYPQPRVVTLIPIAHTPRPRTSKSPSNIQRRCGQ